MTDVVLKVDETGALVPREPVEWMVCFVPPIERQWWHWLIPHRWKHCFAMKYENGSWMVFEPWWSRMFLAVLTKDEAKYFLAWAERGEILLVKEHIPGRSSQLRGWLTCASLIAHLLGRNYWVWTPHALYRKLLREASDV